MKVKLILSILLILSGFLYSISTNAAAIGRESSDASVSNLITHSLLTTSASELAGQPTLEAKGTVRPKVTPKPTATPKTTPKPTATVKVTPKPTASLKPTPSPAATLKPTPKPTASPMPTRTPGPTSSPIPTVTLAPTATPAPSATSQSANDIGTAVDPSTVTTNPPANPDSNGWYTIENLKFGIDSTGLNARATTDGINTALQWAVQQGYNKVKLAAGKYLIQCKWNNRYIAPTDGILVPSGITLDLGAAELQMEANDYPAYSIISVVGQSNVTITGGKLIGDRNQHVYTYVNGSPTHEWGFGICVSASNNVLIQGVTITGTTGDGIILEGSYDSLANGGHICSNVLIQNCDISNCRRQGISVIGATSSEITGNKIYNISGTDPQYGIDVEPEFDYVVDGLKIDKNKISGCSAGAISCNSGANYEVFANTCIGNNIIAVKSVNVKIYGNTIQNSFIRVMPYCTNVTVTDNTLDNKSLVFFG